MELKQEYSDKMLNRFINDIEASILEYRALYNDSGNSESSIEFVSYTDSLTEKGLQVKHSKQKLVDYVRLVIKDSKGNI